MSQHCARAVSTAHCRFKAPEMVVYHPKAPAPYRREHPCHLVPTSSGSARVPTMLLVLMALPYFPQARAAYSEDLAKKLVRLADASYCGDRHHGGTDLIESWTCQVG